MRKSAAACCLLAVVLILTACGSLTSTSALRVPLSSQVALSNSFAGNSWRASMVANFNAGAREAVQSGQIKSYEVVNADNSAGQQISQIEDMIVGGYRAIVIDAASPTALNGVIAKACSVGIKVVVFDSLASAPCAYKVAVDYRAYGSTQVDYIAGRLHGTGNILNIRGIAGTSVDTDFEAGAQQAIRKYPGLHLIGNPYGQWTDSTTESAVASLLPSLPAFSAVMSQGGETYGATEAIEHAGGKLPLLLFGNRGNSLHFWASTLGPHYQTISESSIPGMSDVALWVALMLTHGTRLPKTIYVPLLRITNKTLEAWVAATPVSGVASIPLSRSFTEKLIVQNKRGNVPAVVDLLPDGKQVG